MSRIILPESFDAQTKLFSKIKQIHDTDGATSVLNPLLLEKGIDLDDDNEAKEDAEEAHGKQDIDSKKAEELKRERDVKFDPLWDQHKGLVQFLKTFYKPNINRLGDWGVDVSENKRIVYPPNIEERIQCLQLFSAKFGSIPPAANPLTVYLANNPKVSIPPAAVLAAILNLHNEFDQAAKNAEEYTAERNDKWQPVWQNVRTIANYLKQLFPSNPKKLGRYGFVVDDSPRAPKYRTSTLKLGQQTTIQGATIGGTLINIGTVAINVYKGTTATGEFTTVLPNQSMGIEKGFSNITVTNPSTTTSAKFKVLRSA